MTPLRELPNLARVDRSTVATLCLMGVFVCGLIADWGGVWSHPRKPIGKIESTSGTVRRLPQSELSWDFVFRPVGLEVHDAILTSEQSTAILRLQLPSQTGSNVPEEAVVELGPQSMFVIGADLTQLDVATLEEKIRALGIRARVKLLAPGKPLVAKANQPEPLPLMRDQLATKNGYSTSSGFEIDGAYTEVAQIVGPGPKYEWNPRRMGPLVLRWTPNSAAMYEVTIRPLFSDSANDRRQTSVVQSVVQDASLTLRSLESGQYHWNVRSVNSRGQRGPASTWQTFTVFNEKPPEKMERSSVLAAPRILPVRIKSLPSVRGGGR
jgi:hypothetical protein